MKHHNKFQTLILLFLVMDPRFCNKWSTDQNICQLWNIPITVIFRIWYFAVLFMRLKIAIITSYCRMRVGSICSKGLKLPDVNKIALGHTKWCHWPILMMFMEHWYRRWYKSIQYKLWKNEQSSVYLIKRMILNIGENCGLHFIQ